MIIVRIFQGLGNQMFQYAFARALSLRNHVSFKLDTSYFDLYSEHRQYGLNRFNIIENLATNEEIYIIRNGIKTNRIHNYFFRRLLALKPYYKQPYLLENLSHFDKNLLKINSDTYIEGYFTSELYFHDFAEQIRGDFSFKKEPDETNSRLICEMQKENSVCISIRRGDFVNNPMHDVCDLGYYHGAVDLIKERVNNLSLYIFSDDMAWVQQHFRPDVTHRFITHNFPDFYEDFRLMQNCKHHIIPNSTFSWWAAWLCRNPNKIVIAPQRWLNTKDIDYSHYLPYSWTKIKN